MKTSNKLPLGLLLLNLLAFVVLLGVARPTQQATIASDTIHTEAKAMRVPLFSVIQIQGRAYLAKNFESLQNEK